MAMPLHLIEHVETRFNTLEEWLRNDLSPRLDAANARIGDLRNRNENTSRQRLNKAAARLDPSRELLPLLSSSTAAAIPYFPVTIQALDNMDSFWCNSHGRHSFSAHRKGTV